LQSSDQLVGILAAADTLRAVVPAALGAARALGIHHMELLTGDNEKTYIHNTLDHFGKLTLYTIIQRISTANLAGVSSWRMAGMKHSIRSLEGSKSAFTFTPIKVSSLVIA